MKFIYRLIIFLLTISALCLGYYKAWFLRQPERNIPNNEQVFVSPCNGKIVAIKSWSQASLVETKGDFGAINIWTRDVDTAGTIISIQMDVTNVHFQRAPVSSSLVSEQYVPGSFNNAVQMNNEYGIRFENENNQLLFETPQGKKFKLIQIAGFLARRIEDYVEPAQQVKQGDVIGLIKLGSQITVILPHGIPVTAKVGDVVVDGETPLAQF